MKNKSETTSLRKDVELLLIFAITFLLVQGLADWAEFGEVRWSRTLALAFVIPSLIYLGAHFRTWHSHRRGKAD